MKKLRFIKNTSIISILLFSFSVYAEDGQKVCHISNTNNLQFEDFDVSLISGCTKGDILSIYGGGNRFRSEYVLATAARICELDSIKLTISQPGVSVVICRFSGNVLKIQKINWSTIKVISNTIGYGGVSL